MGVVLWVWFCGCVFCGWGSVGLALRVWHYGCGCVGGHGFLGVAVWVWLCGHGFVGAGGSHSQWSSQDWLIARNP